MLCAQVALMKQSPHYKHARAQQASGLRLRLRHTSSSPDLNAKHLKHFKCNLKWSLFTQSSMCCSLCLYLSLPLSFSLSVDCGQSSHCQVSFFLFAFVISVAVACNYHSTLLSHCVCVPQTHITSHTTVRSQSVSQSVASSSSWPTEDHQRKCSSPFLVHFLKVRTFPFGINDSPTRTADTPPVSTVVPTVSF